MKNSNSTTSVNYLTGFENKNDKRNSIHFSKSSERDAFIEIFKANVPKVLEEEGCVEYSATVDFQTNIPIQETNANVVTVIEKWESLPHLEAHFNAPHMLEYKSKVEGMVEDVSLKILGDA